MKWCHCAGVRVSGVPYWYRDCLERKKRIPGRIPILRAVGRSTGDGALLRHDGLQLLPVEGRRLHFCENSIAEYVDQS